MGSFHDRYKGIPPLQSSAGNRLPQGARNGTGAGEPGYSPGTEWYLGINELHLRCFCGGPRTLFLSPELLPQLSKAFSLTPVLKLLMLQPE